MSALCFLSDSELVARLPTLVQAERHAMADVIEHLVEMERRRLYLTLAVSSLYRYCIQRLGYAEDAALKRHRVAKLALRLPQVLDELRAGSIHLTGLFLLSTHLTEDNASALLGEARGKSRRQIEELIARCLPRPDVPPSLEPLSPEVSGPAETEQLLLGAAPPAGAGAPPVTCSKTGERARARLEPLSPSRLRVEFTARAELYEKLEEARELLSHALPSGDLGELVERAVDALIEQETRKRFGAGKARQASKPRMARELKPGSRHVPVEIERAVWERDHSQCTGATETLPAKPQPLETPRKVLSSLSSLGFRATRCRRLSAKRSAVSLASMSSSSCERACSCWCPKQADWRRPPLGQGLSAVIASRA